MRQRTFHHKIFALSVVAAILLTFVLGCRNPFMPEKEQAVGANQSPDTIVDAHPDDGSNPESGAFSPIDMNGDEAGNGWSTQTWELGATFDGTDVTFAVYSKYASSIMLEIYEEASGKDAKYDYWMERGEDYVWRAKIKDVPAGTMYAFRAWGPNWTYSEDWTRGGSSAGFIADVDSYGNRFNPNKVLYDPYARELSHDTNNPDVLAGAASGNSVFTSGAANRNEDSGPFAPKSYVIQDSTSYGTKPAIPQEEAIIYEAHVRGLTKHSSTASLSSIMNAVDVTAENIPDEHHGTYKGATYMIPYLKDLGITTIELLPVHETENDGNPDDAPGGNYWGYMTFGYFAPDRRYSSDKTPGGPTKEFKEMVAAFHEAGLEVYLDVVFNHTGEGGPWNGDKDNFQKINLMSFRGLDNQSWYSLVQNNKAAYWETTGCGNNLQCDNEMVRKFILDSLTYWIDEMGVDGFRFDLAPVIGRELASDGNWNYNKSAKILTDIASLGTSKDVEMIAEAWDIGAYEVGNFPAAWGDWNGKFRDATRSFLKNDATPNAGDVFHGSYDMYHDGGAGGPHKSVNFIVAHDGMTLTDLVSFPFYSAADKEKYNEQAWPFGPSDGGSDNNTCWDSIGYEAKSWFTSGGYDTAAFRRQRLRNFWTWHMFARGVPMIVYGDEFGRTQNGNNNPYNVDSVATWNNYDMLNTDSPHTVSTGTSGAYEDSLGTDSKTDGVNTMYLFARNIMNLRQNDSVFHQTDYTTVQYEYASPTGGDVDFNVKNATARISISEENSNNKKYVLCISMAEDAAVSFTLPNPASKHKWVKIIDTTLAAETECNGFWASDSTSAKTAAGGDTVSVAPQSIQVYQAVYDESAPEYMSDPRISPDATDFTTASLDVTISEIEGATVYYTTDGSTPSATTGTEYTGAITISDTTTIKAIAISNSDPTLKSTVVSKTYTKQEEYVVYFNNQLTEFTTPYAFYWNDSETPNDWPGVVMTDCGDGWWKITTSTKYTGIIFSDGVVNIQSADLEPNKDTPYFMPDNAATKFTGTWSAAKTTATVTTPAISGVTDEATGDTTVTISCSTSGATVYYTTDGTAPSATTGTEYTGEFSVAANTTVKAIATKENFNDSAVAEKTFDGTTVMIYLNAGGSSLWNQGGAWFVAWTFNGTTSEDAWVTFEDADGDGIYQGDVDRDKTGIIFLRMASGASKTSSANWWTESDTGYWNKTGDLTITSGKNLYTITGWNATDGTWSTK